MKRNSSIYWIASFILLPISLLIIQNIAFGETVSLVYEGEFINGEKQGWWTIYYSDTGTVFCEGDFNDGKAEGSWKTYDKDGRFKDETVFKGGKVKYRGKSSTINEQWLNNIKRADRIPNNRKIDKKIESNVKSNNTKGPPLYAKSVRDKWGFTDANDEMVIDPIYEDAWHFQEGYAPIKTNEKYGIINGSGDIITKPLFDNICWKIGYGRRCVKVGSKWGYLDVSGNIVIKPIYDEAKTFEDNVTEVMKDNKYVIIDINGNSMTYYYSKNKENLQPAQSFGKWGFIKDGKFVIGPNYIKVGEFSCGLANVKIDRSLGFINEKGELVIKNDFDDANIFSEGMACVRLGEKWGYIGEDGKFIIAPIYQYCWNFKAGKARIRTESGDIKYIDFNGNVLK